MKTIIKFLRKTFALHAWVHDKTIDERTCSVCGRCEEYVNDHPTGYWEPLRAGDRAKHG